MPELVNVVLLTIAEGKLLSLEFPKNGKFLMPDGSLQCLHLTTQGLLNSDIIVKILPYHHKIWYTRNMPELVHINYLTIAEVKLLFVELQKVANFLC